VVGKNDRAPLVLQLQYFFGERGGDDYLIFILPFATGLRGRKKRELEGSPL
jgi:hypothetical protein